jgi:hypothetical protein
VQQQRQLLVQLQQLQQAQQLQQSNQSFSGQSQRPAAGGAAAEQLLAERTMSAPALFLQQQLGSQRSLPVHPQQVQQQQQQQALLGAGWPPQHVAMPPHMGLVGQASLPVLQQRADMAHVVPPLASMASLPSMHALHPAPTATGPGVAAAQAAAWQQAQQQGMRALGLPVQEAQQLRRPVVGGSGPARSRFAVQQPPPG